jgi:membrane protein implicated in regulation of membrane protease activity
VNKTKDRIVLSLFSGVLGLVAGMVPAFLVFLALDERWFMFAFFLPIAVENIASHVRQTREMRERFEAHHAKD